MSDKKIIATHSGKYHADDLFAVATLQLLLGEDNTEIVRTRDLETIEKADYVVDVGGVHEPEKERFDHHQTEGAGTHENGIPFASFGLVWKKYGENIAGGQKEALYIEKKVVEPIDASDNGFETYSLTDKGVQPYTIQTMLYAFRPISTEEGLDDQIFLELLPLVRKVLQKEIAYAGFYVSAEEGVEHTYQESQNKEIIVFEKEQGYGREIVSGVLYRHPEPVYGVLYRPDDDTWQVIAVKKDLFTFENRKSLPREWGGNKTSEKLRELTGFEDVLFVHRNGFMARTKSKETAIALAEKALAL